MNPAEIRELADSMTPRTKPNGDINPQHVAIESTLRSQHGHPQYLAELDGPGRYRIKVDEVLKYDPELGEVQTLIDGVVREAMHVRAALVDEVLLAAIVVELERRGYTVTPPAVTE